MRLPDRLGAYEQGRLRERSGPKGSKSACFALSGHRARPHVGLGRLGEQRAQPTSA